MAEVAASSGPQGQGETIGAPASGSTELPNHTEKAIVHLAISPRGDTVVVHGGTTVWALPFTGGPLRQLARYTEQIKTIAWSFDGRVIAIGGTLPEVLGAPQ